MTKLSRLAAFLFLFSIAGSALAQDQWTMTSSGGFGNSSNSSIYGMNVFNGQLYAATGSYDGEVYRSSTGNSNSWSKVFSSYNCLSVEAISSTPDAGGNIFIAAQYWSPDTSRAMRSSDGITWSTYFMSTGAIKHITPFKGLGTIDSMYLAENTGKIYKSAITSNDSLNTGGQWDTVFDLNLYAPGALINTMVKHGSNLYIGTTSAQLYSSADGNNWTMNPNVGSGFGDPSNKSITAIGSFGGKIYVAMDNNALGAQLWSSSDEISWTLVRQFNNSTLISNLNTAAGNLWITLNDNYSGTGQVWKTADGSSFSISDNGGFGDSYNSGNNASTILFGNNVYWGGEYAGGGGKRAIGFGGAEIWRTCIVTPPVVSAGPDQLICQGLSATFTATAGSNYEWSTGDTTQSITVNAPGNYTVSLVGANGCSAADQASLSFIPAPSVTPGNLPPIVCAGTVIPIINSAVSNMVFPDPPIHKPTNDSISDLYNGGDVYDTISVSGLSTACSCDALMSVTIDSLYHTFSNDLDIGIYTPTGSYVTLSQNNGGAADNTYVGTEFIMTSTQPITSASIPYNGSYQPMGDFHTLLGNPNGNWVLRVQDHIGGDDGNLKGWTIRFKVDDTVLTFSWTPAAGLSSTNTLNTIATPATSTNYLLTATNSAGCATQTSFPVNVAELLFAQAADTMCYGSSIFITAQGGTPTTTWSPATGLNTTTGSVVIATPPSSIHYYVVDTIAGCPVQDSIYIYANGQLFLNSPSSQTICYNDTATLFASASGGSAPYTFSWSGIIGDTIRPVLTSYTTYSLSVTDIAGCTAFGSADVSVTPSTDIYGHVSYTGGSVNGSTVVLYKYVPFLTQFDTAAIATTDASGDYYFPAVDHSTYIIQVFPAAGYTTLVPSYYGNAFLWDAATVVTHACSLADTFNIVMVEESVLTGPGFIQGTVMEDVGFGRAPGDPIPGVDVKLGRNPGGQLVTSTTTNGSGTYSFSNLPYDNYTVYADVPGLGRDSSYTVVVDASQDTYLNLDYLVNDTTVFIVPNTTTGIISLVKPKTSSFTVFPNPSSGPATIEYGIPEDATVSLGVYNVLGVKMIDVVSAKQMSGIYRYSVNTDKDKQLGAGVYFVTLIVNDKTEIHRLVIN